MAYPADRVRLLQARRTEIINKSTMHQHDGTILDGKGGASNDNELSVEGWQRQLEKHPAAPLTFPERARNSTPDVVREKSIQVNNSSIQHQTKITIKTPRAPRPKMAAIPSKQMMLTLPDEPINNGNMVKVQLHGL